MLISLCTFFEENIFKKFRSLLKIPKNEELDQISNVPEASLLTTNLEYFTSKPRGGEEKYLYFMKNRVSVNHSLFFYLQVRQ